MKADELWLNIEGSLSGWTHKNFLEMNCHHRCPSQSENVIRSFIDPEIHFWPELPRSGDLIQQRNKKAAECEERSALTCFGYQLNRSNGEWVIYHAFNCENCIVLVILDVGLKDVFRNELFHSGNHTKDCQLTDV